jgi:hypothetical protein
MSQAYDWRSPTAAKQLMQLDREQFAIEFLRRNPAYAEDYHNTLNRTPPIHPQPKSPWQDSRADGG